MEPDLIGQEKERGRGHRDVRRTPAMEPDLIGQEKQAPTDTKRRESGPAMEPDLIGQEKGSRETERLARRDAAARERLGGEAVLDL